MEAAAWMRYRASNGRDHFCCDIVFVPTFVMIKKYVLFLVSGIKDCDKKRAYIHC
jgi:hypothetical protein